MRGVFIPLLIVFAAAAPSSLQAQCRLCDKPTTALEPAAANGDDINSGGTSDTGGNAGHAWTIIVSPSCSPVPPNDCAPKANGEGYGGIWYTLKASGLKG